MRLLGRSCMVLAWAGQRCHGHGHICNEAMLVLYCVTSSWQVLDE